MSTIVKDGINVGVPDGESYPYDTTINMSSTSTKRKLPRRELPYLTTLLDKLPFTRLPTCGVVLRRLMFEVEQQHGKTSLPSAASTVTDELVSLWEYAGYGDILHKPCNIKRQIITLHDSYKKVNKTPLARRQTDSFKTKEADFQKSLESLFDVTVKSLQTSSLITEEDRDFLLHHWKKTISTTQDTKTKLLVEKKLAREDRYRRFTSSQSSPSTPLPQPHQQNPDSSIDSTTSIDSQEEFTPKRPCTSRSGTTVTIPKDIIKKIGPAADRLQLSNNVLTSVVAAVTNHSGGDIDELSLSKSTSRRHRSTARKDLSSSIKKNFDAELGQINFDGKLLSNLGGFGTTNRLAILFVAEEENKILSILKTADSTGKTEAEAVKDSLDSWSLTEKIAAVGFDTTSSNTGVHRGAVTILQQLLNKQLLWLACRHHVLELIIGAAFTELFGDTKSPEVTLFKSLKTSWDSLDLSDIVLPDIPTSLQRDKEELLSFINTILEPENVQNLPRCDYKEFLELAKIILGEDITRKKGYVYQIQRPGADHHARWMSKAIYIMKMSLLLHQLTDIHWQTKKKVVKMSLFVVFVYLRSWFTAGSLPSAAANDLALFNRLQKFSSVHKKISSSASTVLQRHTWYLTEELVPFSIFNEDIPLQTRTNLALKISQLSSGQIEIRKPTLPTINKKSELVDFVGERSTLLFDLLKIPLDFLSKPDWNLQPEFSTMKTSLKNFSPLNDSCERALGLVTRLNTKITRNEESFQELIQVVELHQKKFGNKSKKDLKMFY